MQLSILDSKRVWGNRKGILDRQRQPKPVAYLVRERYNSLACGYGREEKEKEPFTAAFGKMHNNEL